MAEYEKHDDLADNSADEKKIRAAENAVLAKRKKKSEDAKTARQHPTSRPYDRPSYVQNFKPYTKRVGFPPNAGSDLCFQCGQAGHWRRFCPQGQRSRKLPALKEDDSQ